MIWLIVAVVAADSIESAVLFGDVENYGYYFVDLWVGTPPAKQTVIVDTGSRLTAFPCSDCRDCGHHIDSYFDYHNSNSSRVVNCSRICHACENGRCTYAQSYAEGSSISGILVEDVMMFGDCQDLHFQARVVFGCHTRETNLFKTQEADGIMGLASSGGDGSSIVDAMYSAKEIDVDVFSICFASQGGYMTLGGYNASTHLNSTNWVSMQVGTFYAVHFKGVQVGSNKLELKEADFTHTYGTGTIVDSGTTFVYLATAVYHKFWAALNSYCHDTCLGDRGAVSFEPNDCFIYSESRASSIQEFFNSFPVLRFDLGGADVEWMPEYYLFVWPEHPQHYCVGIYDNGRSGGSVLGGIFMRGHDFIFDRTHSQIGFAPSKCELNEPKSSFQGTETNIVEPQVARVVIEDSSGQLVLIIAAVLSGLLCISLFSIAIYYWCCSRKYVQLEAPNEVEFTQRV